MNNEQLTLEQTKRITPKTLIIFGVILAVIATVAIVIFVPSHFERTKNKAVKIVGSISGVPNEYFVIDTDPEDPLMSGIVTEDRALEGIQFVNKELGFNDGLYQKMLKTNSLMGRQTEENKKYKVSWTYHPNDSLEVTYEKK